MNPTLMKLRYAAAIAAVAGGLFAANAHRIIAGIQDVDARGTTFVSTIDGGTVTAGRRSSGGTYLKLSWSDEAGRAQQASSVDISSDLAKRIIKDNHFTVDTLRIKAIATEPGTPPIILADMAHRLDANQTNRAVLGTIGLLGALVWVVIALFGRRNLNAAVDSRQVA